MARETSDPGRGAGSQFGPGSGQPGFHYNRDERTAGRPERRPRGGFLFRNRSLAIVLIDLLVVFVVFVLLRLFVFSGDQVNTVGPFAVALEAFMFEDDLYLTVSVEALDPLEPRSGAESLFVVEFPDGTEVTDVVPASEGDVVEVRHVTARVAGEEVLVVVRIEDTQIELSPGDL